MCLLAHTGHDCVASIETSTPRGAYPESKLHVSFKLNGATYHKNMSINDLYGDIPGEFVVKEVIQYCTQKIMEGYLR